MSLDFLTGSSGVNNQSDDKLIGKNGKQVIRFSITEDGIESSFNFPELGKIPGPFNEIGEGGTYDAVLLDSGKQVGTASAEFELVKQLGNGSFIADVKDVLTFNDGSTLTIEGNLNVQKFENLQPAQLDITSGTGVFEGAKGKATFTQNTLNILDVVNIDVQAIV
jgi:hypothetical protein